MDELTETTSCGLTRRTFLANASALGAAGFFGVSRSVAAEPPPETTRIRIVYDGSICNAPQWLAEDLLRLEGFSEVEYVSSLVPGLTPSGVLVAGQADVGSLSAPGVLTVLDAEPSVVMLAGIHAGCYELFANERVSAIRDLRGKKVAVSVKGSGEHVLVSSMAAYVGIDPRKDIDWITAQTTAEAMHAFVENRADAYLAFPPRGQELRAKRIGRVIVNTTYDRPWSDYFCCMLMARREFVQKHPNAAKRTLRAVLKATDICAQEPERTARFLVAKGYASPYETALEVIKQLPYRRWRDDNPEDTLRFYGLRLHELGMIKATPQRLIAQGSDWRFLIELKRELKA
jgi:NitT/TauT family transport system substrate-binding protein